MGGGLTIAQQAYHDTYDAVGILSFSPVWTLAMVPRGHRPIEMLFLPRDALISGHAISHAARSAVAANRTLMRLQAAHDRYRDEFTAPASWNDHFEDVSPEIREWDEQTEGPAPWRSATMPRAVMWMLAPGSLAVEAAAIVVPVLSVFGERDVAEDPPAEQKAHGHAVDFTSFICPRMGHMHNCASTRELVWSRIHHWAST